MLYLGVETAPPRKNPIASKRIRWDFFRENFDFPNVFPTYLQDVIPSCVHMSNFKSYEYDPPFIPPC